MSGGRTEAQTVHGCVKCGNCFSVAVFIGITAVAAVGGHDRERQTVDKVC